MSYPGMYANKPPQAPQQQPSPQQPTPAAPQNPQIQPMQAAMPSAPAFTAAPPQPPQAPPQQPMSMEDPIGQLRSEIMARFQALEQTIAQMAQKPGEAPQEQQMRSEAAQLDAQANTLRAAALEHRERANTLKAQALTLRAGESDSGETDGEPEQLAKKPVADVTGDQPSTKSETESEAKKPQVEVLSDEADKEIEAAIGAEQRANQLAAEAAEKRAKAYGIWPFIQATAALITDNASKTNKLITDLGTKISDYGKLATERPMHDSNGGKATDVATGGNKKNMQATTPPPQRKSRSLNASAATLLSKYGDTESGTITNAALDAAFSKANITSIQQRIALKTELANAGALR